MGKDKKEKPKKAGILGDVLKQIEKSYGAGTVMDLSKDNSIRDIKRTPSGLPSLDILLGGGVPDGRVIEIFGKESSGKTTLAIQILAEYQKKGKKVYYLDIENAYPPEYAKILGLDTEKLLMSQPDTAEIGLDIVEKLCSTGEIGAILIDSVAQLVPQAVQAKEIAGGTANIATTARLMSQTIPRLSNIAAKTGTTLIFINQIRMNVGQLYGNPETTPGGMALRFAASVRLEIRAGKQEVKNGVEGKEVKIKLKKSKVSKPQTVTNVFLTCDRGFDKEADLLNACLALGVIERSGAWFTYGEIRAQGFDNLVQELKNTPGSLEEMQQILQDSI